MKCPICHKENTLEVHYLYQYCHIYKIKKDGVLSRNYKKVDNGWTEHSILTCSNGCDVDKLVWWLDDNYNLIIENKDKFN